MFIKYSILIPVLDGMPYLPPTVASCLKTQRSDFELVIHDDGSRDGSAAWINSISDSRVSRPEFEKSSTMLGHWDSLEKFAQGEWLLFLGQDDLMCESWPELLDELTAEADARLVDAIVCKRFVFDWTCGPPSLECPALGRPLRSRLKSLRAGQMLALMSVESYHSLPQAYTSSFIRKELAADIRDCYGGKLFNAHPQDAGLAASISSIRKRYLFSKDPFSRVGTSERSAGRAVLLGPEAVVEKSETATPAEIELRNSYLASIANSAVMYPAWAGPFGLGDNTIYFWQALKIHSAASGNPRIHRFLSSRLFLWLMFSTTYFRVIYSPTQVARRTELLSFAYDIWRVPRIPLLVAGHLASIVGTFARLVRLMKRIFLGQLEPGLVQKRWKLRDLLR